MAKKPKSNERLEVLVDKDSGNKRPHRTQKITIKKTRRFNLSGVLNIIIGNEDRIHPQDTAESEENRTLEMENRIMHLRQKRRNNAEEEELQQLLKDNRPYLNR